jgi:hypothetical protein
MKSILTILAVLTLCVTVQAQAPLDTSFLGGEFGMIVQKGSAPAFAYSLTKNFTLEKAPILGSVLGPLCSGWEGSILYSDKMTSVTTESFVGRLFYYKVICYRGFFVGGGAGGWHFVNTSGSDMSYGAYKAGFGYANGPLICRIAGEIVKQEKNDFYWLHVGAILNL